MNNPAGMTVFLSHSTKDAEFVTQLAERMSSEGFKPWLCETSIEPATDWVEEIDNGLKAANLVLLVWSPDAAASYATGLEWRSALAREIALKRLRLGVVLLRDCELPELLRTRQYIDARKDSTRAIAAVLEWLKGRRNLGRLAGDYAPVYLEGYPNDDLFVGRESYLTELRNVFSEGSRRFLLYGEPGAGKSTLALRFAWEAQKDFDAVVFQRCGQRSVEEIVGELAYKLRGQLGEQVLQLSPEEKLKAAVEWLRARQSLLVLDDVWSADVKQMEPGGLCSVLHTSRQQSLSWVSPEHTREVVSFTNEECELLFHASLDKDFGADEVTQHCEPLLAFAERVERLPIAVAVSTNLLRRKKASGLHRGTLGLRLEELRDGVRDVPGLFRMAIESQPERERRLLAACAVCAQEGFWLPLAAEVAELSEDKPESAADHLVHSSLLRVIDRKRRRFSLHALVRDRARVMQGNDLGRLQERHAVALEFLYRDWKKSWKMCWECLPEIIPAAKFLSIISKERMLQLTYWGYRCACRTGDLDSALAIEEHNRHISRNWDELTRENVLQRSYGNQALILHDWGRSSKALELLKKQEKISTKRGNKEVLQASYGNQALILIAHGELRKAMGLLKKQEKISVERGIQEGLQASYGNQALILHAWRRPKEAMKLLKKQERICVKLRDPDLLQTCFGGQAAVLQSQRQLKKAWALRTAQEKICLKLGKWDSLQICYGNQAQILRERRLFSEALELLRKKRTICMNLRKPEGLAYCYWDWSLVAGLTGDTSTKKEKLEAAFSIFKKLHMARERDAVRKELTKAKGKCVQVGSRRAPRTRSRHRISQRRRNR